MRVVLVDDDKVYRLHLRRALTALGVEVVGEAETGVEAIAVVRGLEREGALPDGVVTDYEMPEMNGLTVCRTLAAFWPELRLVLVTGHEDDVVLEAGTHAGAHAAIVKGDELAERVVAALR